MLLFVACSTVVPDAAMFVGCSAVVADVAMFVDVMFVANVIFVACSADVAMFVDNAVMFVAVVGYYCVWFLLQT